jgi:hypothetical protein
MVPLVVELVVDEDAAPIASFHLRWSRSGVGRGMHWNYAQVSALCLESVSYDSYGRWIKLTD